MNERKTNAPHDHIVSTEFDGGEGVLVDLNSKRYYQLNETAMFVWRCLERGQAMDEIVAELTRTYQVNREQAHASVEKLLDNLRTHHLVRTA